MPFTLIRGTYHVRGYKPDGDSVRFMARDDSNWRKLRGRVALNARGHAQLRLEAIDTLETHYAGQHQPLGLATRALDFLLHELGIAAAQFDTLMMNTVDAEDGTPGYIVAREAEKFGRPIAFAFAGAPPEADGSAIFLTPERLRQSLNFKSVAEGLAYPTYYAGLFPDLRAELTAAVAIARAAHREIWAEDVTTTGFDVNDLTDVTERHVIMPKLFRRLTDFLRGGGSVEGFKQFLEALEEDIVIIATGHFTHLDTVVDVQNRTVQMTVKAEEIVFDA
jgi:hypothetical protein